MWTTRSDEPVAVPWGPLRSDEPPPVLVVRATGELDFLTGPRLVSTITRIVTGRPRSNVELRLDAVRFIDVAGIRSVLACRDVARRSGSRLVYENPSAAIQRILGLIPELRARFEEE
jgi:anti-anti-sigma factor